MVEMKFNLYGDMRLFLLTSPEVLTIRRGLNLSLGLAEGLDRGLLLEELFLVCSSPLSAKSLPMLIYCMENSITQNT